MFLRNPVSDRPDGCFALDFGNNLSAKIGLAVRQNLTHKKIYLPCFVRYYALTLPEKNQYTMLAEKIKDRIRLMAIIDSFGERGDAP